MIIKKINIAEEFSDMPYGRYTVDSPDNGTRFRDDFLFPLFEGADEVHVYMDGALGYGSSFLDEAFAGLYRTKGISKDVLRKKLKLFCSQEYVVTSAWDYIDVAKPE